MGRRRRSWLFWVIVPALFAVAAVTVWIAARRVERQVRVESDSIDEPDDELGYRLRTDLRDAQMVIPGRPVPPSFHLSFDVRAAERAGDIRLREFAVSTNALGFRGPEVDREKPAGTFRAVCLGDSITFGWGVAEEESYPRVMEREMNRGAGTPWQVINGGVPGYDLERVLGRMERDMLALRPDLVTLCKLGLPHGEDPVRAFRDQLARAAAIGRRQGFAVAFLCPPRSTFDRFALTPRFRNAMEAEAAEQDAVFVDFMTLIDEQGAGRGLKVEVEGDRQRLVHYGPGGEREVVVEETYLPQGEGADPLAAAIYEYMDHSDRTEALMYDDGHPDAEGHALMGVYLAERFREEEVDQASGE